MNEELFKRIGLLIKNARDRKNLSQQEVAEYVKVTNSIKKCNEKDILIARYGASIGKILTGLSATV